jgi:hypothetical protein
MNNEEKIAPSLVRTGLSCDSSGFDTKVTGGYVSADRHVVLKLDSPRHRGTYFSVEKHDFDVCRSTVEHYVRLGYIKGSTIDRLFKKVR